MNLDREIKGFQILFLNLLLYVIWSGVVNIIFRFKVNHSLFIIVFIASILLMLINQRIKKNKKYNIIALIIPSIMTLLLFYYNYSLNIALFSMIYALLVLILIYNTKDTIMEYKSARKIGRLSMGFALIIVVAAVFFMRNEFFEDIIKYILMLMISNVILLRETRCYSHNLKDKKMRIMNMGIVIFFFAILSEKAENLFKQGLSTIYNIFSSVLVEGAVIFVTMTRRFWLYLWRIFNSSKVIQKSTENKNRTEIKLPKNKLSVDKEYDFEAIQEPSKVIIHILQIIILFVIIFIVYKLIKKYIFGAASKKEDEIREKISVVKDKKDNKFFKSMKRFMDGKGSIREQIYYVFGNFQNKAYNKELYKNGMTASELNHATKNHIKDKAAEIDDITKIYNEAKFSNHPMEKDDLEIIVKGYREIKDEL